MTLSATTKRSDTEANEAIKAVVSRYADIAGDSEAFAASLAHTLAPCVWAHPLRLTRDRLAILLAEENISSAPVEWSDNALRLDKGALAAVGESFLDIVPQLLADRVFIDPISAEDVVEFIGLALDGHDGMIATVRGRSAETVLRRMSLAVELAVGAPLGERARDMVAEAVDLIVVVDRVDGGIVIREIVSVDDAGQFGFRTSEILANS